MVTIFALAQEGGQGPLWVKSRHSRRKKPCLLYSQKQTCVVQLRMSAKGQKRTSRPSFDPLVSTILHRLRRGNAESLRGLEVEEQLDFACLLHRQVGGFLALENTADVPPTEAGGICAPASIASQAACCHELVIVINRRDRIAARQCSQLFDAVIKEYIRAYD